MGLPRTPTFSLRRWILPLLLIGAMAFMLVIPPSAYGQLPPAAQPINNGIVAEGIDGCDFVTGNVRAKCIPNYIAYLVKLLFGLIGLIFVVNVMIAGYQIAIGAATDDKTSGKQRLYYSVIGVFVSTCAFLLIDFVISALING